MFEKEIRVFGPPGTGKTTYLSKLIKDALHMGGFDKVLVSSFSKTAVAELINRNLNEQEKRYIKKGFRIIGTLHSIAFHALNRPKIIEKNSELIEMFNKEYPQYELTEVRNVEEDTTTKTQGDKLFLQYNQLRSKLIPRQDWNDEVLNFAKRWEQYKLDIMAMDFQDLIDYAYKNVKTAPNDPVIGFFDEAQDYSPAEMRLVRKWGSKMNKYYLAGDDDQSIFEFKGADPAELIKEGIDKDNLIFLRQSYRVSKEIHDYSTEWIKQVSHRQQKDYNPDETNTGFVEKVNFNFYHPIKIMQLIKEKQDESFMIIASCSYMLRKILSYLKSKGIPFENPFRRSRRDWNPLHASSKATAFGTRLYDFLSVTVEDVREIDEDLVFLEDDDPFSDLFDDDDDFDLNLEDDPFEEIAQGEKVYWTGKQFKNWALITKGLIKRGKKKELEEIEDTDKMTRKKLLEFFDEENLQHLILGDLEFFLKHLTAQYRRSTDYPLKVYENFGINALVDEPRIKIGTIHSVKGGEADNVIIFPDISKTAYLEEFKKNKTDAFYRLFYVGFTRAKKGVYLAKGATPYKIKWL